MIEEEAMVVCTWKGDGLTPETAFRPVVHGMATVEGSGFTDETNVPGGSVPFSATIRGTTAEIDAIDAHPNATVEWRRPLTTAPVITAPGQGRGETPDQAAFGLFVAATVPGIYPTALEAQKIFGAYDPERSWGIIANDAIANQKLAGEAYESVQSGSEQP